MQTVLIVKDLTFSASCWMWSSLLRSTLFVRVELVQKENATDNHWSTYNGENSIILCNVVSARKGTQNESKDKVKVVNFIVNCQPIEIISYIFRLLLVVRNPVTRAISDYTQSFSKNKDMKKFEELSFVNGSYELVDTSYGAIKIGVYAKFMERWLRFFPLKQFLIVSGERLIADPAAELYRVQDFLNLKRVITEKHFYFNSTKGFPCMLKSESRSTPHCLVSRSIWTWNDHRLSSWL